MPVYGYAPMPSLIQVNRSETKPLLYSRIVEENFTTLSGTVSNADIYEATVWLDINSDGILDPNEPSTLTNIEGQYELYVPDSVDLGAALIRAQQGLDVGTGASLMTTLTASPTPIRTSHR